MQLTTSPTCLERLGWAYRCTPLPVILLSIAWVALAFDLLPINIAMICAIVLVFFAAVGAAGCLTSFTWRGTKTIVARRPFGGLIQRSVDAVSESRAHWKFLDCWTGLGAVSVAFNDGASSLCSASERTIKNFL